MGRADKCRVRVGFGFWNFFRARVGSGFEIVLRVFYYTIFPKFWVFSGFRVGFALFRVRVGFGLVKNPRVGFLGTRPITKTNFTKRKWHMTYFVKILNLNFFNLRNYEIWFQKYFIYHTLINIGVMLQNPHQKKNYMKNFWHFKSKGKNWCLTWKALNQFIDFVLLQPQKMFNYALLV